MARTQQLALYEVEASVDGGYRLADLKQVQQLVDALRETDWWQRDYWMVKRVEVMKSTTRTTSFGTWFTESAAGVIQMVPEPTIHEVLHEVAHVLNRATGGAGHDPRFCQIMLVLTHRVRGAEAWQNLRAAMQSGSIVFDDRED